jgi:hypothetical protein
MGSCLKSITLGCARLCAHAEAKQRGHNQRLGCRLLTALVEWLEVLSGDKPACPPYDFYENKFTVAESAEMLTYLRKPI